MKRTTKLSIETERIVVIRRGRSERGAGCPACREFVRPLNVDEAARVARVSARAIYRMVETRELHLVGKTEELLICPNALGRRLLPADALNLTNHSYPDGEPDDD